MVVGLTTTCAISAFHHYSYEFEPCSWPGVLDKTSGDKVCQWLATGRWFSPVSSTNKTDSQYNWNIVESLVKQYKPIKPNNKFVIPVAVDMFSGPATTQDQTLVLSKNLVLILFSLLF
jgi:hypothetical protein